MAVTEQRTYSIRRIGITIALAVAAAWLLLYIFWPPSFSAIDVAFFKEAGINLSLGRGLIARADPHYGSLELLPYRTYPPLFPALFGLYSMVVGVSAQASRFFDVGLNVAAGLLFLAAILPRNGSRRQLWPCLLFTLMVVLTLPAGPFWQERERPDVVGFVLILTTLLLLQAKITYRRLAIAGFILALLLLTSPFTFVLNTLVILLVLGRAYLDGREKWPPGVLLRMVGAGAAGFAVPTLAALLFWTGLFDADTSGQILAHATGQSREVGSGMGYFLMLFEGNIAGYLSAIRHYTNLGHKVRLAYLFWVILLLAGFFIAFRKQYRLRSSILTWFMLLVLALTPLLLIPYQSNYMSLTAAILLVLFIRLLRPDSERERVFAYWLVVLGFGLIAFFQMVAVNRELYVSYRAGPSYAVMQEVLDDLRPAEHESPLLVATEADVYFLFSGKPGFEVVPFSGFRPEQLRRADLLVFTYQGEAEPLEPRLPRWARQISLEPVFLPEAPPPWLALFGRDVTNGPDSWLVHIYRPLDDGE